jgi:streptomycin 6-kinase
MWRAAEQAGAAGEWCARWGVEADGAARVTDHAYLLPVRRHGARLMLKLADPQDDEAGAGAFLAALGGRGAVRVLAHEGAAVLMERVMPVGPTLAAMALEGRDEAAVHILCDVIGVMHAALAGLVVPGLIALSERVGHVRPDARLPADLRAVMGWAEGFVTERVADRDGWRALHGDLHHFNVLHDRARGWLVIDPKGISGPGLYDYAILCLNPLPHGALVHDPMRMGRVAGIVAERTGAAAGEVLGWVAFQACLSLSWSLWDDEREYWLAGLRVAAGLAGLRLPGER